MVKTIFLSNLLNPIRILNCFLRKKKGDVCQRLSDLKFDNGSNQVPEKLILFLLLKRIKAPICLSDVDQS